MEKRKVTMTSVVYAGKDENGIDQFHRHQAIDHVALEHLDTYLADAKTRWQHVEPGDVHDPGPGGEDGDYSLPEHITRGISLDDHLDALGVPNRTDEHGNVQTSKGA